jgi:transcriptional regulator with XRE-family HTH domain
MTNIETIREYRREGLEKDDARAAGEAVLVRLASRLYALRTSLKLTQDELAARAGLDQASISDIENGDANPTARTIGRLASGLGVAASVLLEHGSLGVRFGSAVMLHDEVKWQGATEANRTAATKITVATAKDVAVRTPKKVAVG